MGLPVEVFVKVMQSPGQMLVSEAMKEAVGELVVPGQQLPPFDTLKAVIGQQP